MLVIAIGSVNVWTSNVAVGALRPSTPSSVETLGIAPTRLRKTESGPLNDDTAEAVAIMPRSTPIEPAAVDVATSVDTKPTIRLTTPLADEVADTVEIRLRITPSEASDEEIEDAVAVKPRTVLIGKFREARSEGSRRQSLWPPADGPILTLLEGSDDLFLLSLSTNRPSSFMVSSPSSFDFRGRLSRARRLGSPAQGLAPPWEGLCVSDFA